MLNAVGLQNPGVHAVIAEELPQLPACFHKPVNRQRQRLFGGGIRQPSAELLDPASRWAGWRSTSPAPTFTAAAWLWHRPGGRAQVTRAVRVVTKKPVIIKLSPNVTDIWQVARPARTPARTA
jgi:dihydroorotate dehydrogenase (NAD+) catalytic subunit